tara:strand:+ start:845 stop:997 length:153 start_codon:yes stop_codon:yes gene_type:complete
MESKNKKNKWVTPISKELGSASKLIKGFAAGKELSAGDGLFDPDDNPVSN